MATAEIQPQETVRTKPQPKLRRSFWILAGFSLFYFADVWLRASEKHFWYDELVTLYICRLPSFRAIWEALLHGVDFNPPLFHLVTKTSELLFGEGQIGMRLPEILGYWVLCLSLYRFVSRRAGTMAGYVAMAFPVLTGAFYYAYEARPHGIVLGFCGLALVCWQMSLEAPRRNRWLAGFSASLFLAFMLHCYALLIVIPFAVAELFRSARPRQVHWRMWIAMAAPAVVAAASYIPLLRSYRALTQGTNFNDVFPPTWAQIPGFYGFLLYPCIVLVTAGILLLAMERILDANVRRRVWVAASVTMPELVLAATFLALPAFGVMLARFVHGPFFARYFISALIGFCILLGMSVGIGGKSRWVATTFSVILTCTLLVQLSHLAWHRYKGWGEKIAEPSTGLAIETTPGQPVASQWPVLSKAENSSLPVAVPWLLDFLYTVHYAPQLTPRLYPISRTSNEFGLRALQTFRQWCPIEYNPELTYADFLHKFSHFLVYGNNRVFGQLSALVSAGGKIKSLRSVNGYFLAEVEMNDSGAGTQKARAAGQLSTTSRNNGERANAGGE